MAMLQTALGLAACSAVVWFSVVSVVVLVTLQRYPSASSLSMELGPEPPALAGVLLHAGKVPSAAVAATVVDLAARGYLRLDDVTPGHTIVRVVRGPDPDIPLYERRVLDHVASLAVGGVVPAGALTTGPMERSRTWRSAFDTEVVDDALRRGLVRPRVSGPVRAALTMAALVPAMLVGLAVLRWMADQTPAGTGTMADPYALLWAVFLGGLVFMALRSCLRPLRRPRRTDAGQAAAATWLGVCRQLRAETFAGAGPGSVVVWDRYLAYAIALKAVPSAVTALPLGQDPTGRVWSSFGGRWRRVRVRSSTAMLGSTPLSAILLSLPVLVVLIPATLLTVGVLSDADLVRQPWIVGGVLLLDAVSGLGVWWAVRNVVRAVGDIVAAPVTVEGQVVYLAAEETDDDEPHVATYYTAVDDGTTDLIHRFPIEADVYERLNRGMTVRVTMTPYLRRVSAVRMTVGEANPGPVAATPSQPAIPHTNAQRD
jgi:Predicted membrane protein (DUF2207)